MTVLHEVAEEVGAHERTLRRGLAEGLLRGRRPSSRTVELAPGEVAYLREHWGLLAALREALRRERSVRLAVLIGSAARGSLRDDSDVDLLVELVDASWRAQDGLRERLGRAAGRPVDLVVLEAARQDPLLLDSALRDGRVLVDRDRRWPSLLAERADIARAASHAHGSVRERKLAARRHEISRDRRALRAALDRFAGADEFARVWASDDPDEINRRDQVERPYERIINHLQEIIDLCEAEEVERGSAPPADAENPGRWRRAALRGHISQAQAERWQRIARSRQRLAHHYADLSARQGAEIYERAGELLRELPRAIHGLGGWIEELWPAPAQGD